VVSTLDNIIYALTHIFNRSFTEGKFIASFKKAKVIPVFKNGCHTDVTNYRPISLLSVTSEVLEKSMHVRLVCIVFEPANFF